MTGTGHTAVAAPATRPSPVAGDVRIVSARDADGRAAARVAVTAAEPVFAGHYPDFPIFPGVCVVECAHRAATATAPGPAELAAVVSARFAGAVYPGDVLDIALAWRPDGDGWRCDATVTTERGKAASVRLRYRAPGGEPR
ncbi:hypothetical protein AB0F13_24090 [Streptomyces sp. NPDC026206]|uniref:hypothetical protein n=1 Tax=Streptomyces sp. NPDC026206 TaxID=3157089 RepID=UPI0033EF876D